MTFQPWLSVLIPTYNGEEYLPFALDSIVAQGDRDIECIAIDDGSTDATRSILHDYQDKLSIKILHEERHGNWAANTNFGLAVAKGKYVCFLHQDDVWLKDRIITMKRLIHRFPEVVFFLHSSLYLDIKGNQLGLWQCPLPPFPEIINSNLMIEKLLVQNFIAIPAPIFKREAAQRVGGLDTKSWYTADWDFWLKLATCGAAIYHPQPLTGFRIHESSQTIIRSSSLEDFQSQLEDVAARHLANWEIPAAKKKRISKVARFSIQVNTSLAGKLHGRNLYLVDLLLDFLLLGPRGSYQYLRDSRILERISARLKARLRASTQASIE